MRMVVCIKLKQNLEGLESQPFPGELGKKIFNEVSKVAWKEWLEKQKMLVNEYRLNLSEIKARQFLMTETENYFFGVPEKKSID